MHLELLSGQRVRAFGILIALYTLPFRAIPRLFSRALLARDVVYKQWVKKQCLTVILFGISPILREKEHLSFLIGHL